MARREGGGTYLAVHQHGSSGPLLLQALSVKGLQLLDSNIEIFVCLEELLLVLEAHVLYLLRRGALLGGGGGARHLCQAKALGKEYIGR